METFLCFGFKNKKTNLTESMQKEMNMEITENQNMRWFQKTAQTVWLGEVKFIYLLLRQALIMIS